MVVYILQGPTETPFRGLERNDFTFPFRIHQVPMGIKFFRVGKTGIVRERLPRAVGKEGIVILSLEIGKSMSP